MSQSKYIRSEGYFAGYQDAKLYFQKWEPESPKGTLIITHGHGEHTDCYQRVVDALSDLQLRMIAWDWRGHGRSDGTRGYAEHFNNYCHDFEIFLKKLQEDTKITSQPIFLLAHSMGGLIQLKTVLSHPKWQFAAQILSSPLLGISVPVPAYKQLGAYVLINVLPKMTLWNEIENAQLSRDPAVQLEYDKDVHRHGRISAGVYLGSLDAMEFVKSRAEKIVIPTLLQVPENDPVVSTAAGREVINRAQCSPKVIKIYPDRKHEIYNDLGREEVFADLKAFLSGFLK